MPRTTQLTVSLKSQPGCSLTRPHAGDAAQHRQPGRQRDQRARQIRLIVNDPGKAKRALRRAKYPSARNPSLVRLRNKPGALARVGG